MLMHICPHQGCREIIPIQQPYCDTHVSRHKQYDKAVRYTTDAKLHEFYVSSEWEQVKPIVANKYHGLCLWTYYHDNDITPYNAIHHIRTVRENWEYRLDINNLIPLSSEAHAQVHALYKRGKDKEIQKELNDMIEKWNKEFI